MRRKVAVTFILGLDCLYDLAEPLPEGVTPPETLSRELPAPIFALEVPETAVAGVPFSINAWVGLADPLHAHDEILPGTFKAELDPVHQRIVVTGCLRRPAVPPTHPIPRLARALIVGIRVTAPAGMWRVTIPPSHYAPEAGAPTAGDAPAPRNGQWIHVQG